MPSTHATLTGLKTTPGYRFAVAAQTSAGIGRFTATRVAASGRVPTASPRSVENSDEWFSSACFDRPRGGKLETGPLWDFDLSTMNHGVTKGGDQLVRQEPSWSSEFAKDPAFEQRVAERWQFLKPMFETLWVHLDAQRASIATASAQDEQLWAYTTYDANLNAMETLLGTREALLNTQWTPSAG